MESPVAVVFQPEPTFAIKNKIRNGMIRIVISLNNVFVSGVISFNYDSLKTGLKTLC